MRHSAEASNAKAAVFTTHALGRPGQIFALPRANAPQAKATADALAKALSDFDAHDRALALRTKNARDAEDRADIAAWDREGRQAIRKVLDKADGLANADTQAISNRRATLLNAPPAADVITATLDGEWRSRFRAMSEGLRENQEKAMTAGENDVLLLALARDAIVDQHSVFARRLWEQRMMGKHAAAVAELDEQTEGIAQIRAGVASLRSILG
jgi:hypothetical protein